MGLDLEPARSISAFGRNRGASIRSAEYVVPQSPSAVLNHTVPGMVTSPLTVREWGRIRAGMWPDDHKVQEKRRPKFVPATP